MTIVDIRSQIEILTREESLQLLATQAVGRFGFIRGAAPEIVPVTYALDGDAVVFATAPGGKLWAAERSMVVFEVDALDNAARSGWSVVLHGYAQEITGADSPKLVARVGALPLHPWAGGTRSNLVRIAPTVITGRRVGAGDREGVD